MKTLFIPAFSKVKGDESRILDISRKLPKKIAIAYSIQYKKIAEEIRKIFSKEHNITGFFQILGCSKLKYQDAQAVLLIGSGRFHAVSLALQSNIPIYLLDSTNFQKISYKEIEKWRIRQKYPYVKFLNAKNIGILISTKPGQQNLARAMKIKKRFKDKNSYLFIGNNIEKSEFENFPQIESWVNTACPRLDFDFGIINI